METQNEEKTTRKVTVMYRLYGQVEIEVPVDANKEQIEEIFDEIPLTTLQNSDNLGNDGDDAEMTDYMEVQA